MPPFRRVITAILLASAVTVAAAVSSRAQTPATTTPASGLTLPGVLADVLASNPDLASQRWQIEASRARAQRAGSWENPMLELGVENVPTTGRFDEDPMTMKTIALSQKLPVFGANRLARRAGDARATADSAGLDALRRERVADAWDAYVDAWDAERRAGIADAHHATMHRMIESARARYESGRGRLDELLRAQAEEASVMADAASWRAARAEALARLGTLRGAAPGGDPGPLAPPPAIDPGPDPAPWLAGADAHPRLREQEASARGMRLDADAARRTAWPDLEVRGEYQKREPLAIAGGGGTVEQDDMWSAMVGVTLPVFAHGREFAEARALDAEAHAAEARRGAERLAIAQAIAAAHARALEERRIVTLLGDTVQVTQQRTVDAAWSTYQAGGSDLLDVLDAAHMLYAEELREADASASLAHTLGRLVTLSGRLDLAGLTAPPAGGKEPR